MKTIFAVTEGEYSDYEVIAIFTDKKKAINYCESLRIFRLDKGFLTSVEINGTIADESTRKRVIKIAKGAKYGDT